MHVVLNETCQNSWYLIHIPQKFEPLTPMTCVHQKPLIQKKLGFSKQVYDYTTNI